MRTLGGRSHDATAGVPVSDPWIPGIPDPNIPNHEQNGSTPRGKLQASHGQTIRSWLKFCKKHGWLMPKPQGQNAHSFGIEGAIAISESGAWDTLTQVRVGHSIVAGVPILLKTWNHEPGRMSLVQTWAAEVKAVYFLHAAAWNIWKAVSLKFKHFGINLKETWLPSFF